MYLYEHFVKKIGLKEGEEEKVSIDTRGQKMA